MPAARTTDELLTAVKARCQLPDADGRLTTAEIYALADEVMSSEIADLLLASRASRWASVTGAGITSGVAHYDLPARCLQQSVLDVRVSSAADSTIGHSLPQIPLEEAWRYASAKDPHWSAPYGYYWLDERVVLVPTPTDAAWNLVIFYARQPSRLVAVSACAVISSSSPTVITTTATVPSTWAASETLDIVKSTPSGGPWFFTTGVPTIDLAGTLIGGTSITVSGGLPTDLPAGSFVCLDGTTCVPTLPEAAWPVLVSATACEVLTALGDGARLEMELLRLERARVRARIGLKPRNDGQRPRVINRNGPLRWARQGG